MFKKTYLFSFLLCERDRLTGRRGCRRRREEELFRRVCLDLDLEDRRLRRPPPVVHKIFELGKVSTPGVARKLFPNRLDPTYWVNASIGGSAEAKL